jgi:MoaA/NifB/PqqE/SkfB family radical SAM enzyme
VPLLPYVYSVYLVAGLGEGFLNPNFWQIVRALKKTGVKVGYFTNGVLLNKQNIKKTFAEEVDSVLVSFDSIQKEKFEEIREGANYEEVLNHLKNLLLERKRAKANLSIGINFAAQKSTIKEMPDVIRFAKEIGLDFVYFSLLIAHRKEFISETLFNYDKKSLKKIFVETEKLAQKLKVPIRLPNIEMTNRGICPHLWREMIVFGNGDVSPCPHFRQAKKYYFIVANKRWVQEETSFPSLIVGNVYQEPILKIWNNGKYGKLRRSFKEGSLTPPCRLCYFRFGFH